MIESQDRVWVAGLSWLTFTTRPPGKDLLDLARASKANSIALRNGGVFQAGFCDLDKVPKVAGKTTLCLGPAVVMSRPVPWRGIFDLGDGQWWYLAARDNFMITIDGDVVGSREHVDSIAQSHAFYDDWDEVEGTLEDVLQMAETSESPQVPLTRARPGHARTIGLAALATLGLAAAAYAGFVYSQHVRLEQAVQSAQTARAQLREVPRPTQAPPGPSTRVLDTDHFLEVCAQHMLLAPSVKEGWELVRMTCTPGQLQLTWKKHAGADEAFQAQRPGSIFHTSSQTLVVPEPLSNHRMHVLTDQPGRAASQAQRLFARLTGMGFEEQGPANHYTFGVPQAGAAPRVTPGAPASTAASPGVPAGQAHVVFSIAGLLTPANAQQLVAGLAGVVLSQVTWSPSAGWTYAGDVQ